MSSLAQIGILTLVTVIAGAAALGMAWAFLSGAFRLMEPALARPARPVRSDLVHGTRAMARQFAAQHLRKQSETTRFLPVADRRPA